MKKYSIAFIVPCAAIALTAGCASHHSMKEHSLTSYDNSDVTNTQKGDFIRTTENYLRDVEQRIDGWKVEAKDASGSMKETRYEQITALEMKLDRARNSLNELKAASKEDYKTCKERVEKSVEALNEELDKSKATFR